MATNMPTPDEAPEQWQRVKMDTLQVGDLIAYEDERMVNGVYQLVGWHLLRIVHMEMARGWYVPHFENVVTGERWRSYEEIAPNKPQIKYVGN